jgi:hypothetical protein
VALHSSNWEAFMKIINLVRGMVAGIVLAGTQLGTANAGQIATPILFISNTSNQLVCIANNVSGAATTVTVKILSLIGNTQGSDTCTLPVGDRAGCQAFLNTSGHCVITVSGLTNDQVRARLRGVMFSRSTTGPFATEAVVQAE